ncbi:hypothetical protein EGW08_012318 [Elysia chlorotica]|uniref:Uncharacterized protein n=1 Tax=Elysia chlorotica TaxID=188477 RepID=A0A3S1BB35_ELYCH|nr:hypothetical protein EGW08_012318 [Elysia chlorotica]
MEEDATISSVKDRPSRSNRRPVSAAPHDELSAEHLSHRLPESGATAGDHQAMQAAEKVPEKERSETGLGQPTTEAGAGATPGIPNGDALPGEVPHAPAAYTNGDLQMVNGHATPGLGGFAASVYEGPAAVRIPPPPMPRSFPALPANTTDDAKLVDHYEHAIGFSASLEKERLEPWPSVNGPQDLAAQLGSAAVEAGQGAHWEVPPKTGLDEISSLGTPVDHPEKGLEYSQGLSKPQRGDLGELGLVDQLAEIGQPDSRMPAIATGQSNGHDDGGASPSLSYSNAVHPEASSVHADSADSVDGADSVCGSQTDQTDRAGQSLKDILSNIVLEEQVITIKLHRDPPPPARRNRRDRLNASRAGPASATDVRTPGAMLPQHPEELSDHLAQLAGYDRWSPARAPTSRSARTGTCFWTWVTRRRSPPPIYTRFLRRLSGAGRTASPRRRLPPSCGRRLRTALSSPRIPQSP